MHIGVEVFPAVKEVAIPKPNSFDWRLSVGDHGQSEQNAEYKGSNLKAVASIDNPAEAQARMQPYGVRLHFADR